MALVVKIDVVPDKDCRYGLHRAAMEATQRVASAGNSVDDLGMLVGSAIGGVAGSISNGGDDARLHAAIVRALPAALRPAFTVTLDDVMQDLLADNVSQSAHIEKLTAAAEVTAAVVAEKDRQAAQAAEAAAEAEAKQEKAAKTARTKAKRQQAKIAELAQLLQDTEPGAYSEAAVRTLLAERDEQLAAANSALELCRDEQAKVQAKVAGLKDAVQQQRVAYQRLQQKHDTLLKQHETLQRTNSRLREDNAALQQAEPDTE